MWRKYKGGHTLSHFVRTEQHGRNMAPSERRAVSFVPNIAPHKTSDRAHLAVKPTSGVKVVSASGVQISCKVILQY